MGLKSAGQGVQGGWGYLHFRHGGGRGQVAAPGGTKQASCNFCLPTQLGPGAVSAAWPRKARQQEEEIRRNGFQQVQDKKNICPLILLFIHSLILSQDREKS